MSEPQMTKEEIIYQLFEGENGYIKKPETRAMYEGGTCSYKTEDGRMCAVGKCLNALGHKYGRNNYPIHGMISEDAGEHTLDDILLKKYRGHSIDFWSQLQSLHDSDDYWDSNGFRAAGENRLREIKKEYVR